MIHIASWLQDVFKKINCVNKYKLNYDEFLVQQKCCVIMNVVGSVDRGYQALIGQ
jgi:hypothetical protein